MERNETKSTNINDSGWYLRIFPIEFIENRFNIAVIDDDDDDSFKVDCFAIEIRLNNNVNLPTDLIMVFESTAPINKLVKIAKAN